MTYDTSTWYLTVIPVILAYLLSILANMKLNAVRSQLGGAVRTLQDLGEVRGGILFNKRCAWLYLALWGGFFAWLVASVQFAGLTFAAAVGHFFAFGVLTLPGGLWTRSVETKFKAMMVDRSDPALGKT